jgi:hypothetical protein
VVLFSFLLIFNLFISIIIQKFMSIKKEKEKKKSDIISGKKKMYC